MLQTSLLLMKSLSKTETPILNLQCVLCFQRQLFRFLFYLTSAGVSAVERLPVLHHRADYILISFGIIGPIVVSLNEFS